MSEQYDIQRIFLPASEMQAQALLLTGAFSGPEAVSAYYQVQVQELQQELALLQSLSERRGFLPFASYDIHPNGMGWQVRLLRRPRPSLAQQTLRCREAVELGIDLCAALAACREAGWLYANLRPEQIFRKNTGEWAIGDVGFLPLSRLPGMSLPERCRSAYTPPEVSDAYASPNTTMDTYALGLVLYGLFNGGVLPGQTRLAPRYADGGLSSILLKACAIRQEERYETPEQMGRALLHYVRAHQPQDIPLQPPQPEPGPRPEPPAPQRPAPTPPKAAAPRKPGKWLLWVVLSALLTALGMGYQHHFVHTVRAVTCRGEGTRLTVTVDTALAPDKLTVVCQDTYGNALYRQPLEGSAVFEALRPGTQYLITVKSAAPHQLRGQTTAVYATPSQTRITNLTAVTGQEAGSVIVTFGVEGVDSESWTLTCFAEGFPEERVTFGQHTVTVSGLQVGAEYTFTLTAPVDIRLGGQTTLQYTPSAIITTPEVQVADYENGILTVTWTPDGTVTRWMAHCYDGMVYDQLLECSGTTAVFDNVTPGALYTIEITAAGQTMSKRLQFQPRD